MKNQYKTSLFIFRRDLRKDDNTALIAAMRQSKKVIPIFIFDPRQVNNTNEYKSNNSIQFMIASLHDLSEQLKKDKGKLYLFYGIAHEVVENIVKNHAVDAVFVNRDYTPFSINRDKAIEKVCHTNNIDFQAFDDYLLNPPYAVKTQAGTPYSVFTAYYKQAKKRPVIKPQKYDTTSWYTGSLKKSENESIYNKILNTDNQNLWVYGGTSEAQKLLNLLPKLNDYSETRDIPSLSTSNLSAHNKFGTVSIRQVYQAIEKALGPKALLLQQLYWRDFFTMVAYYSPFVFGQPFHEKYKKLTWKNDTKMFHAWCQGTTGFPIVDAGMRQLNATGFMHNRVRMIVGSFLTKDLHIDWLWGEKYFATRLVDYDPSVNNGNWQWTASTGCDAQPYFRIFNPWLQQKKFDPECTYIKQWVPELQSVSAKIIHNWFKPNSPEINNYPRPIVDHKKQSALAKQYYKRA